MILDVQKIEDQDVHTINARFRPNTPLYILIGLVVVTAGVGSVFVPDKVPTVIGFCGTIGTLLFGLIKQNDANDRAEAARDRAERKLTVIEQDGKENKETVKKVHTLVNSQMAKALRIAMDMSEFKAFTTKDPEDAKVAASAKSEYEDHMRQQSIVDGQETK